MAARLLRECGSDRRLVHVANYMGGAAAFPVRGWGLDLLLPWCSTPVPASIRAGGRPARPLITLDPVILLAFVADLGIDKVMVYQLIWRLDITAARPAVGEVEAGAGPRHGVPPQWALRLLDHRNGQHVVAFAYDAVQGTLDARQTVPALPVDYTGRSTCADIHVAPSGKFLYGSNRGHDSIVAYAIDVETGLLVYIGHTPSLGKTPRNFAIDPTGTYLFAAHQDSDSIVAFRIDPETGQLTPTGQVTEVSMPVCVRIL